MLETINFTQREPVMALILVLVLLFGLMCGAQEQGQLPIDARSSEEAETKEAQQQKEGPYQSLEEVPPIEYIRENIPDAAMPQVEGHYYESLVPDTVDLAERARLFVQHVANTAEEKVDWEPRGYPLFDVIPPRIRLNHQEAICAAPKYRESLVLLQMMTGSEKAAEIEETWAKVVLKGIGPDGLFYVPLTGRPWDTGAYSWLIPKDGGDQYAYLATSNGRLLGALGIYYEITGDETWIDVGKGIVDRMNELAIKQGDSWFYPKYVFFPGEELTDELIQEAKTATANPTLGESALNFALWQTWMVTGLSQFYYVSRYEPARELALGLLNYIREHRFDNEGKWDEHFHCGTLGIQAMCEYARASGDMEWAQLAKKAYEWGKSEEMGAIPEMGYFAVMQMQRGGEEPMEPCSVADMTAIALKLTGLGVGDYWEDVDQYTRNCLIEAQVSKPYQISDFVRMIQEGNAKPNHFWKPSGAKEQPVAYTDLTDDFAQRMVGFFSTTIYPNELHGWPWHFTCCSGNCSRALYYVWENILEMKEASLKVNLLMNRASIWADIDSYLPYTGKVEIHIKKPLESMEVRMNDWIEKEQVQCLIDDRPAVFSWKDRYLVVGAVEPDQQIRIEFPIEEKNKKVKSHNLEYEVTFRGNDVVDIKPEGNNIALFAREHYRSGTPRYIKVRRFVPEKTVEW